MQTIEKLWKKTQDYLKLLYNVMKIILLKQYKNDGTIGTNFYEKIVTHPKYQHPFPLSSI